MGKRRCAVPNFEAASLARYPPYSIARYQQPRSECLHVRRPPCQRAVSRSRKSVSPMASLDTVSIGILLGALLVLAGILSSLVAMRFGAPLLLVFLIVGMLAGEAGPGGIRFDDVRTTYLVGSIALALILFDGGLRTRFATFRSVFAPSLVLATIGVLLTAALTAPAARYVLGLGWIEALLVGAVVASTDAAAVFFLVHARGLRLRPRVGATLEVESGSNDPFAVFLTIVLVEFLLSGEGSWQHVLGTLAEQAVLGTILGIFGGRARVRAQPARAGAGPACAVRRHQRAGDLRARLVRACLGISRGLSGRPRGRQPADARPQHRRGVSRRGDLARADRDVRAARPAGLAGAAGRARAAGARGRGDADACRAAGRGFPLPGAVPLLLAREAVHLLGRIARRGRHFPRLDPADGGLAAGAALFRCRVRGGAGLAPGAGLDHRLRGAAPAHRAAAPRPLAAPGRARSARPAGAGDRRLSARSPTVPICGGACCRHGRGRPWWCATSTS